MTWKPDYILLAAANNFLRATDTVDDVETAVWITAASRAIDEHCHRQFGSYAVAAARIYRRPPVWDPELCLWTVDIDDVQDTTGMTVAGVALASSGAVLLPDNAPSESKPYERLGFTAKPTMPLTVVCRWGWLAIPVPVTGAVRLQLSRFSARRDSPYGVAGSPSEGSELRLLARLDPDVAMSLRGLGREGWPW